jgi:hypothetical protein
MPNLKKEEIVQLFSELSDPQIVESLKIVGCALLDDIHAHSVTIHSLLAANSKKKYLEVLFPYTARAIENEKKPLP